MKHWIPAVIAIALIAVLGVLMTRHFSERHRQTENVRHDAKWFTMSLRTGKERAVAHYLSRPEMDHSELEEALLVHGRLLMDTDFDSVPVRFRSDGSTLYASFKCSDGVLFTFYTENGGDVWWIAELGSP